MTANSGNALTRFGSSARPLQAALRRPIWIIVALSLLVLVPRALLMSHAHSERIDDEYHLDRGILFLDRTPGNNFFNDPPVGEALDILPLWLAKTWSVHPDSPLRLWGHRFSADKILAAIAIWKCLLFLPLLCVAFLWLRELYGSVAGWLGVGILLVEPTITAHTPLPSLDVLGAEGIVISCYCAWRYFRQPSLRRLILAAVTCGAAMTLKHTAIITPFALLLVALLYWIVLPLSQNDLRRSWKGKSLSRIGALGCGTLLSCLTIWGLFLFDVSKPILPMATPTGIAPQPFANVHPLLSTLLDRRLPAGLYISSILEGSQHADRGHPGFLFGEIRKTGWWYYFPVVATYKIPLPLALLFLLSVLSLWFVRPRWDELGLLLPVLLWAGLMMHSNIDIGWRHFLPAYFLLLLLSTRFAAVPFKASALPAAILGWAMIVLTFIESTVRYHPDYLCYLNFPRPCAWMDISDSNVDWGQAMKQVKAWLQKHPSYHQVALRDFVWGARLANVRKRLGNTVTLLDRHGPPPTSGLLIVSPVPLVGLYEEGDSYAALRAYQPIAIIGHSLRVYDLDRIRKKGKPFDWHLPAKSTRTRPSTMPTNNGAADAVGPARS